MKAFGILLVILLASCKSSTESISTPDLLPLHEGNQWIYRTSVYHDSLTKTVTEDTASVISEMNNTGMDFFKVWENGTFEFYSNRSNGIWNLDSVTQQIILTYEYPSHAGNEYVAEYDSSSTDSSKTITEIRVNLIATNENVTVPAGSFSCYHYHLEWEQVYFLSDPIFRSVAIKNHQQVKEVLFAPGIGIVKTTVPNSIYNGFPNGLRISRELKQYSLH